MPKTKLKGLKSACFLPVLLINFVYAWADTVDPNIANRCTHPLPVYVGRPLGEQVQVIQVLFTRTIMNF